VIDERVGRHPDEQIGPACSFRSQLTERTNRIDQQVPQSNESLFNDNSVIPV
jgi:hypothetical protein